ncbi:MAG: hypothetical protein IKM99_05495 [Bacteroidales bacterium]|nr:hypothetical protein [Bacteroidales bacterium]
MKKSKNRRNGSSNSPFFTWQMRKNSRPCDSLLEKQIVLCPNINDNDKEWGKEFVEKMTLRLVP